MSNSIRLRSIALVFLLLLVAALGSACGEGEGSVTGGEDVEDARSDDASADPEDAGELPEDARTPGDSGAEDTDGVSEGEDTSGEGDEDAASEPDAELVEDVNEGEDAREPAPDAGRPDIDEEPDAPSPPQTFVVWMAPDGVDSRDGSSEQKAVKTLNRVQDILVDAAPQGDVEVRIAPGRYRGQKVTWTFYVPDHTVTFTRLAGRDDRPIFDGCVSSNNCPGGTWFILQHSDGAKTNLVFNYLRVENYQTAISMNGNRNSEARSNGGNRIFGCYFYRIGNVFNSSVAPSTAAIRLVNSDDNEIINNHFVDIINTSSPGILHAIYAAHMSDRNQILRNRFENNAGDAVRFRDYSNDNIINDNNFIKAGIEAGYTEWYCDHDARSDCTKATPECPSWGNQFRDNHLNGNYACGQLGVFKYFQSDSTTGCSPPSAGARRLRTSGNTQSGAPCQ